MKVQVLASAALMLLSVVPGVVSEGPSIAIAKSVEMFEDSLVSAGLYDEEVEVYDEDMIAKSGDDKGDKNKKSDKNKRSNKRRSSRRSFRRRSFRRRRSYKSGMCRRPSRSDRELCNQLEDEFCSGRRARDNPSFCRHLGFRTLEDEEEDYNKNEDTYDSKDLDLSETERIVSARLRGMLSTETFVAGQCSASTTCESIDYTGFCCSQYGYCGQGSTYCGDGCLSGPCDNGPTPPAPAPTPSPPSPSTPPPNDNDNNSPSSTGAGGNVVAFVENWKPCPANVDGYTHIFIAFATSYNTACQIIAQPICSEASSTQVADWQEAGIKVVISYGGWNMNSHWQDCFGKEDQASTDLVNIVSSQDFDGVNIDFESQVDSSAQNFLKVMNVYLRDKMDALSTGKKYELSHVPMDVDMAEGKPYFNILASQKDIIDYVMPQFYNNGINPGHDGFKNSGAQTIYSNLASTFGAEKVIFGFCIGGCTKYDTDSSSAIDVLKEVKSDYPCNGGTFFWSDANDPSGFWSGPVHDWVSANICSAAESEALSIA